MSDASFPYDVTFEANGVIYGFMLVTPSGESKQIQFTEAQAPESQRLSTKDIATTQDFDPRNDTPFSMSDLTGGVGQLEWDFNDDTGYWWSSGVVTHVAGRTYLPPAPAAVSLGASATGDITSMLTYLDVNQARWDYAWEGPRVWVRDASNGTNGWVNCYTASVDITDICVMDNVFLIAVPTLSGTTDFLYEPTPVSSSWAPTSVNHSAFSAAGGKPKFFEVVRGTCYAMVDKNKVFYTTDPLVDGWAGPIDTTLTGNISGPPGDDGYGFTGSNSVADFLFVKKQDAVYSIDSQQDVIEVLWQWKDRPSPYNFKFTSIGGDQFVYSVGTEVYVYDPQTGMSNSVGLSRKTGFSIKEIKGLACDNQYVYVLARVRVPVIRSAECMALLRGVKIRPGVMAFEVLWEDTDISSTSYANLFAFPQGIGTRLYWNRNDSGTTDMMILDLPAEWDESSNTSFATAGSLYTSVCRSGFPGFEKRFLYFNLNGSSLSSTNKITVKYTTDSGATYTTLGDATSTPYEANFSDVHGATAGLRFDFVSAGTVTPIMLNFDHHMRVRFKYLPTIALSIRIGKGIELRNSGKSNKFVWELWDDLKTLRTSNYEITYKDFLGNEFPVTIDIIGVKPTRHEKPLEYEEEAAMVLTRADRGA